VKSFSVLLPCVAAAILCVSAFAETGGKSPQASTARCAKAELRTAVSANKPRLISEGSGETGILEVEEKNRGLQRLTWNFFSHGSDASVACYHGRVIAVQIIPKEARCLMSVRKKTGAERNSPAVAVEKLLCE
jgi:hypothetical protein